ALAQWLDAVPFKTGVRALPLDVYGVFPREHLLRMQQGQGGARPTHPERGILKHTPQCLLEGDSTPQTVVAVGVSQIGGSFPLSCDPTAYAAALPSRPVTPFPLLKIVLQREKACGRAIEATKFPSPFMLAQVATLADMCSGTVLVFCNRRVDCEIYAAFIAAWRSACYRGRPQAERAALAHPCLPYLTGLPTYSAKLAAYLECRTAFHHAHLTKDERDVLERGVRGEWDAPLDPDLPSPPSLVLCATSTLAVGVNLPVDRVILAGIKHSGNLCDPTKFMQMVGRAGRVMKGRTRDPEAVLQRERDLFAGDMTTPTSTGSLAHMEGAAGSRGEAFIVYADGPEGAVATMGSYTSSIPGVFKVERPIDLDENPDPKLISLYNQRQKELDSETGLNLHALPPKRDYSNMTVDMPRLMSYYLFLPPDAHMVRSGLLADNSMPSTVLTAVSHFRSATAHQVLQFLGRSYELSHDGHGEDMAAIRRRVQQELNFLVERKYIRRQSSGPDGDAQRDTLSAMEEAGSALPTDTEAQQKLYTLTELGTACMAGGFTPEQGARLYAELAAARQGIRLDTPLHLLFLVAPMPVTDMMSSTAREKEVALATTGVLRGVAHLGDTAAAAAAKVGQGKRSSVAASAEADLATIYTLLTGSPLAYSKADTHTNQLRVSIEARLTRGTPEARLAFRLRDALVLRDLMNDVAILDVAERYQIECSRCNKILEDTGTLSSQIISFTKALRWTLLQVLFEQFRQQAQFGVSAELTPFCAALPLVRRYEIIALAKNGIMGAQSLAAANPAMVCKILSACVPYTKEDSTERDAADNARAREIQSMAQAYLDRRRLEKASPSVLSKSMTGTVSASGQAPYVSPTGVPQRHSVIATPAASKHRPPTTGVSGVSVSVFGDDMDMDDIDYGEDVQVGNSDEERMLQELERESGLDSGYDSRSRTSSSAASGSVSSKYKEEKQPKASPSVVSVSESPVKGEGYTDTGDVAMVPKEEGKEEGEGEGEGEGEEDDLTEPLSALSISMSLAVQAGYAKAKGAKGRHIAQVPSRPKIEGEGDAYPGGQSAEAENEAAGTGDVDMVEEDEGSEWVPDGTQGEGEREREDERLYTDVDEEVPRKRAPAKRSRGKKGKRPRVKRETDVPPTVSRVKREREGARPRDEWTVPGDGSEGSDGATSEYVPSSPSADAPAPPAKRAHVPRHSGGEAEAETEAMKARPKGRGRAAFAGMSPSITSMGGVKGGKPAPASVPEVPETPHTGTVGPGEVKEEEEESEDSPLLLKQALKRRPKRETPSLARFKRETPVVNAVGVSAEAGVPQSQSPETQEIGGVGGTAGDGQADVIPATPKITPAPVIPVRQRERPPTNGTKRRIIDDSDSESDGFLQSLGLMPSQRSQGQKGGREREARPLTQTGRGGASLRMTLGCAALSPRIQQRLDEIGDAGQREVTRQQLREREDALGVGGEDVIEESPPVKAKPKPKAGASDVSPQTKSAVPTNLSGVPCTPQPPSQGIGTGEGLSPQPGVTVFTANQTFMVNGRISRGGSAAEGLPHRDREAEAGKRPVERGAGVPVVTQAGASTGTGGDTQAGTRVPETPRETSQLSRPLEREREAGNGQERPLPTRRALPPTPFDDDEDESLSEGYSPPAPVPTHAPTEWPYAITAPDVPAEERIITPMQQTHLSQAPSPLSMSEQYVSVLHVSDNTLESSEACGLIRGILVAGLNYTRDSAYVTDMPCMGISTKLDSLQRLRSVSLCPCPFLVVTVSVSQANTGGMMPCLQKILPPTHSYMLAGVNLQRNLVHLWAESPSLLPYDTLSVLRVGAKGRERLRAKGKGVEIPTWVDPKVLVWILSTNTKIKSQRDMWDFVFDDSRNYNPPLQTYKVARNKIQIAPFDILDVPLSRHMRELARYITRDFTRSEGEEQPCPMEAMRSRSLSIEIASRIRQRLPAAYTMLTRMESLIIPLLAYMRWMGIGARANEVWYQIGLLAKYQDYTHDYVKKTWGRHVRIATRGKAAASEHLLLTSPANCAVLLYNELGLPSPDSKRKGAASRMKKKTHPSTGKAVLEHIVQLHPVVRLILNFRSAGKRAGLLKGFKAPPSRRPTPGQTGDSCFRIHADYDQTSAATGRITIENPPMQQTSRPFEMNLPGPVLLAMLDDGVIPADKLQPRSEVLRILAYAEGEVDKAVKGASVYMPSQSTVDRLRRCSEAEETEETRGWLSLTLLHEEKKTTYQSTMGEERTVTWDQTWQLTLQNRHCIGPEKGYSLVSIDFKQMEMRLLAHLSTDKALKEACATKDVFTNMASDLFHIPVDSVTKNLRGMAKQMNYAVMYGMGAVSLAKKLSVAMDREVTESEAQAQINRLYRSYPKMGEYQTAVEQFGMSNGYVVTMRGRRREVDSGHTGDAAMQEYDSAACRRQCLNSVVQGSAADVAKEGMLKVFKRLVMTGDPSAPFDDSVRMVLGMHDEILLEIRDDRVREVVPVMQSLWESSSGISVALPGNVKVGKTWATIIPYDEWVQQQ
ncbi:hypothetical protein KIPB_001038, partial [Kipferlia bialata]